MCQRHKPHNTNGEMPQTPAMPAVNLRCLASKIGGSMTDLIKSAEIFARSRHAGQFRKGDAQEVTTF